jgi:hypothetical protein
MESGSEDRVALVVAKTLPPTFSLTQSDRDGPSGDGTCVVLRSVKSGTSWDVSLAALRWEGMANGLEVPDVVSPSTGKFSAAACGIYPSNQMPHNCYTIPLTTGMHF